MKEKEITDRAYEISEQAEEVNQDYIVRLGKHIKYLEEQDEIDPVYVENRTQDDIKQIQKNVRNKCIIMTGMTIALYHNHAGDIYAESKKYYAHRGITQVPYYQNTTINAYMNTVAQRTQLAFDNISRTTVVDKAYRDAVDESVALIQSGKSNYDREIRRILANSAIEGTRVQYASGMTRRMDSACRMNILEGVRRIDADVRRAVGKEFGADGMEISAHALCAVDHQDIQGEQYSMSDYENLNNSLDRPIGELNCQHYATPIILGISEPVYDEDELDGFRNYSEEEIDINGKSISRYECSQLMRQLETNVRYQKDALLMAKASGDKVAQKEAKAKIAKYKGRYDYVCKQSGLPPQPKRMSVPSRTAGYVDKMK